MLPKVDSEIASVTFWGPLTDVWTKKGRAEKWGIIPIDDMHCVIGVHARNASGEGHPYFLKLGAEYYDAGPPTVKFVEPASWKTVREASRWWPRVNCPSWLGLHLDVEYEDKHRDQ